MVRVFFNKTQVAAGAGTGTGTGTGTQFSVDTINHSNTCFNAYTIIMGILFSAKRSRMYPKNYIFLQNTNTKI